MLMVVDRDSLLSKSDTSTLTATSPLQEGSTSTISRLEESMALVLDRNFVQHDTYALFCHMMETGIDWYEWRTESIGAVSRQDGLDQAEQERNITFPLISVNLATKSKDH